MKCPNCGGFSFLLIDALIYEIFDYKVAYEIRLQDAMEEDLLCPFIGIINYCVGKILKIMYLTKIRNEQWEG